MCSYERVKERVDVRAWAVAICLADPQFPAGSCLDTALLEKNFRGEFPECSAIM